MNLKNLGFTSAMVRGVTRLDGARVKKQDWRPHVRTWRSFGSKCTVMKKVHVTLLGLFGAQGIVPPFPSLVAHLAMATICVSC